jgi:hypothetical protein
VTLAVKEDAISKSKRESFYLLEEMIRVTICRMREETKMSQGG